MTATGRHDLRAVGLSALAFALVCALALALSAISDAADSKTLGNTKRTPSASCPGPKSSDGNVPEERQCQVVGSTTAIQIKADGKKPLMKAPAAGRLVAWAVDLAKPRKSEREAFGELFKNQKYGEMPTARIAVLQSERGSKYRLKAQSPVVNLDNLLGEKQFVTLNDPLRMRKGEVLGLTIPTWTPNFAFANLSGRENSWRASRQRGKCASRDEILEGRPHQKVDSVRNYGCTYDGARVLYWGYFVPDRAGGGPS